MPSLPERWLCGCLLAPALILPVNVFSQSVPDVAELMQRVQFSILDVEIEGNSLVDAQALSAAAAPFLGTGRRMEHIESIRMAILETYRARGHELVSVVYAPSRSTGGRHLFVVLEVELGKVRVAGATRIPESSVRAQLPALREGELPDLHALARQLALFNDNPGRSATIEYSSGEHIGVADAEIRLTEGPQSRFGFMVNNTGTAQTGRTRAGLSWSHYNAFGVGHQATLGVNTSLDEPAKVRGVNLGYRIPLPALGDALLFGASASKVKVGQVADVFNIAGESEAWNIHYVRNLRWTADTRHMLQFGYDERRYRDLIDFFGTNLGTAVTAKPLSLGYRLQHNRDRSNLGFGLTFQRNLSGDGRNGDAAYAANRVGAEADWSSLLLDAVWQKALPDGWSTTARLAGQYARKPLISAEQFGLGGAGAVRGLGEREGAGDRGLRVSGELYTPRIGEAHQLLLFVDGGRSSRLNVLPGESSGERVLSYGLGWRASLFNTVQIVMDVARVANGTPRYQTGSTRVHASASMMF